MTTPDFLANSKACRVRGLVSASEPLIPPKLILIVSAPSFTASSTAFATIKPCSVIPFLSENTRINISCASGATPLSSSPVGAGLVAFPTAEPAT